VPVLLLLAGAVILAGVVAVAMGHGGEMAEFPSDYIPPTLGDLLTAADVAMVRPPAALWGYNTQVTDEALSRIAQIVTERDVEIAVLRQQLADLRSGPRPAWPILAEPEPFVAPAPAVPQPAAAEPEVPEPEVPEAEPAAEAAETAAEAAEPVAAEPPAAEAEAAEPVAAQDDTPPAPAVPSDEAAAPGDE
jgi:hypothetical protein